MADRVQTYHPLDAFGFMRSYMRHVVFVREALGNVTAAIDKRALTHDTSKLLDDEFAGFCRINAAARINKFGSPEYAANMKLERGTIDQHFARNRHHAEYYTQSDAGGQLMSFLDVIEMVCDWWGARKGYDDPRSWADTVELNLKQKGPHLREHHMWLVREVAAFLEDGDRNVSR